MDLHGDEIRLITLVAEAVFPVLIDPLATTAAWTAESNQADARLGFSVAGAGDVNGDGYSDVIVSAHFYANPELLEGRAAVYHGSAMGLSLIPN